MMNIIEKLGGYDNAKKLRGATSNALLDMKTWEVHVDDIDEALLGYRREHNIFEVGDKVVLVDLRCSNDIWCVSESSTSDYVGVIKEGMLGFSVMHKSMTRHATYEEIQAGRRL